MRGLAVLVVVVMGSHAAAEVLVRAQPLYASTGDGEGNSDHLGGIALGVRITSPTFHGFAATGAIGRATFAGTSTWSNLELRAGWQTTHDSLTVAFGAFCRAARRELR